MSTPSGDRNGNDRMGKRGLVVLGNYINLLEKQAIHQNGIKNTVFQND